MLVNILNFPPVYSSQTSRDPIKPTANRSSVVYLTGSDSSRSSKDQNSHHHFHRRAPAFVVTDTEGLNDFQKYISCASSSTKSYSTKFHCRGVKTVSWKLTMCNAEQMVFPNVKLPAKHSHTLAANAHTHAQNDTQLVNNDSHSSIHRQICKAFPAPQFEDPKVKVRNQVQVGLMWKTEGQISSKAESCCRKTGRRSNRPDYKGRAVTFNGGGAAAESVHVRHRSWRSDAAQQFPHTPQPSPATGPYRRRLHASLTFISGLMS